MSKLKVISAKTLGILRSRFTGFGLVGTAVMLLGIGLLYLLIEVWPVDKILVYLLEISTGIRFISLLEPGVKEAIAYAITAFTSIESNFLLNRQFNWRDRAYPGTFWLHWRRFHVTRIFTILLNQVLFNLIIALGFPWFIATAVGIGVSTIINFRGLDRYVFEETTSDKKRAEQDTKDYQPVAERPYRVSVIIPAHNEQRSIRRCLDALLNQTYAPFEIILVTDPNDATLEPIQDLIDQGLVKIVEFIRPTGLIGRDANARRLAGGQAASGDIFALTDAKMWPPPDWIEKLVDNINRGYAVVAGITKRMPGDNRFMAVLLDEGLIRENVRYVAPTLDKTNLNRMSGLPVTACLGFTREVFKAIEAVFPAKPFQGWEDFALTSIIVLAGFVILTTNEWWSHRTHKVSLRLAKHFMTGVAARIFLLRYPDNPFAKHRHNQALVISAVVVLWTSFVMLLGSFYSFYSAFILTGSSIVGILTTLGLINWLRANDWRAFFFPPLNLLQLGVWLLGYWISVITHGKIPPWLAEYLRGLRVFLVTTIGGK